MIRLRDEELFTCGITLLFSVFWPEKDGRNREHRYNSQQLVHASILFRFDKHFTQRWIKRKLDHFPAKLS